MDMKYNKVTFGVSKDIITPAQTATMIGFGCVFGAGRYGDSRYGGDPGGR